MACQNEFSVWDDSTMDNWYNAARQDQDGISDLCSDKCRFKNSNSLSYENYSQGLCCDKEASVWFYSAMAADEGDLNVGLSFGTSINGSVEPIATTLATSTDLRNSLNKPLPAVPTPYYEYMFANAGHEYHFEPKQYSPDNLSFEIDDDSQSMLVDEATQSSNLGPLTPPPEPATFTSLNTSAFTQYAFAQAGIIVTTKELPEDYLAAAGSSFAGDHMSLNQADEIEKSNATVDFYGGVKVEEFPSPYHAPLIGDFGLGDIHDGAEAFPKQWTFDEKRPKSITCSLADAMVYEQTHHSDFPQEMSILKPRSQKYKVQKKKISKSTKVALTGSQVRKPAAKKRIARDSFATKLAYEPSAGTNSDVQYHNTKKARFAADDGATVPARRDLPSPSYSILTAVYDERESISSLRANNLFEETEIAEPGLRGFPGQFEALNISEKSSKKLKATNGRPRTSLTFGDRLHPNYLFTHKSFKPDPLFPVTEYNYQNLPSTSPLACVIADAASMTDYAASDSVAALRNRSQADLRTEAHLECTCARLEGVSVGQYRYYQGHLNIEEYNERGMCICWDLCVCNKLCTRFGDLICPCAKNIFIHKN